MRLRGIQPMLSASAITALHDQLTDKWHQNPIEVIPARTSPQNSETRSEESLDPVAAFADLVARQHQANFDLWHIEDEARAPGATDSELAAVKRHIDQANQLRNDLVEQLDRTLLERLAPQRLPNPEAPLNSESPGLIIDRLSILALKIFHTHEETARRDASASHIERNRGRLAILQEQRADLAGCLDSLWHEALAGTRQFKLYRQLKMYNDPDLNPAIYRKPLAESGR